jgi:hypothetical protein
MTGYGSAYGGIRANSWERRQDVDSAETAWLASELPSDSKGRNVGRLR